MAVAMWFLVAALSYGYRWRGVLGNVMWVSADEGGDEVYTYSIRLDSLRNLGVSLTAFSSCDQESA